MSIAKSPSFETGNHPSEFNGCQRGSYCGRAKEGGWEVDLRVGIRTRIPSGVFARVVRHRLAIREDRVRIILPPLVLDIYRSFLSVSLAIYCTQPEGGYRRYHVE